MLFLRPLAQQTLRASARPLATRGVSASWLMFAPWRQITTRSATPEEGTEILKKQRAQRPISPHITIYEKQLTFLMSGGHRITGVAVAVPVYAFLLGYVGLPAFGVEMTSDALMNAFGALPLLVKIPAKFVASLPFTYHCVNGVRHLTWDTAHELSLKGVYRTGYTVLGFTVLASTILAFI